MTLGVLIVYTMYCYALEGGLAAAE